MSTNPGIRYMPVPSISRVPLAGRPFSLMGTWGVADGDYIDDTVVFDDDVHRADGRGSGSVDDGDAANDQAVVGAAAVFGGSVGGGGDATLGQNLANSGEERGRATKGTFELRILLIGSSCHLSLSSGGVRCIEYRNRIRGSLMICLLVGYNSGCV